MLLSKEKSMQSWEGMDGAAIIVILTYYIVFHGKEVKWSQLLLYVLAIMESLHVSISK